MRRVLIANRGEIACRIQRACRADGLETVAVYSDADADALHVAGADFRVRIGPAAARESYLRPERVLDAARETGAHAVHPGYGFLSENPAFARAVEDAGLIWLGPTPATIEAMGDKGRARSIAVAAGVPVLPGSAPLAGADTGTIHRAADAVGYPLLVKASGGGGGIGMRRVDDPGTLPAAIAATERVARQAFGDGGVFLERYVTRARHVEVQVFGYGDGHAIHLHERDCSIQRRFQKVVEESPAPGLPAAVRARMCAAATALARHVGYRGPGTVEFIVDADTFEFFFLEMNTRVQVEHPVTEMVTGWDIVRSQLRLALGTLAPAAQTDVAVRGAAIECRLYAENPARNFLPSPGTLEDFHLPADMAHCRIDTGVRRGDTITPHYDPMIAKLIAWGPDRDAARARMGALLREARIAGLRSNLDFLRAVIDSAAFAAGRVDTGFIERERATLLPQST